MESIYPEGFQENVERYIEAAMADATDDVDCSLSTIQDRGKRMGDFIETYGEPVAEALYIAVEMMACENGYYASGARYIGKYTQRTPVELLCDGGSKNNGAPDSEAYGSYRISTPRGQMTKRLQFERGLTNNQAEYKALIAALEDLLDRVRIGCEDPKEWALIVQTDSQLVIGHLTLNWNVCEGLSGYAVKAVGLLNRFHNWQLNHSPGTEVKRILGH